MDLNMNARQKRLMVSVIGAFGIWLLIGERFVMRFALEAGLSRWYISETFRQVYGYGSAMDFHHLFTPDILSLVVISLIAFSIWRLQRRMEWMS